MSIDKPAVKFVVSDLSDIFEFVKESMRYYDGPLQGVVICKTCRNIDLFDCEAIVADRLWHWTIINPAEMLAEATAKLLDAPMNFLEFRQLAPKESPWLSVVEDLRSGAERACTAVWIHEA